MDFDRKRCNAMVLFWITNTLSPSIARSIAMKDNACEVWNCLKDRYSAGELEYLRPLPECTYACICGALKTLKSYREMDDVISFLRGKNESFAAIKSWLKVYSLMVLQEKLTASHDSKTLTNTVNGRGKENQGRGQSAGATRLCTFYSKTGHTANTCYRKHGLPSGHNNTHSTPHN